MSQRREPVVSCAVCTVCGATCEERHITIALPRSGDGIAMVKNVPAEVCPACGETKFTLRTTSKMLALFRSTDPPDDLIMVPIYNYQRSL